MTNAYRFASAGLVSTTGYLAVAFATYFGIAFFDKTPGPGSIAGSALIVLSCVLIGRRRTAPSRGGLDGLPPPR